MALSIQQPMLKLIIQSPDGTDVDFSSSITENLTIPRQMGGRGVFRVSVDYGVFLDLAKRLQEREDGVYVGPGTVSIFGKTYRSGVFPFELIVEEVSQKKNERATALVLFRGIEIVEVETNDEQK